jgi:hypothetical protein
VSVSGTVEQIRTEDIARMGALLRETAFEMSRRLGWSPVPGVGELTAAAHAAH